MTPNSERPDSRQNASVSLWLTALRDGDQTAARRLWTFIGRRLTSLAKSEVAQAAPCVYDEDDVALSAFNALCHGMRHGRYDDVVNRGDLWRLLAVITINKARTRATRENRQKRGGSAKHVSDGDAILALLTSPDPPPELNVCMQDECERMLGLLQKQELKMVVLLRVEGYTNEEIACHLGCTRRSVQRRLTLIRDIWADEIPDG